MFAIIETVLLQFIRRDRYRGIGIGIGIGRSGRWE